MTKARQPLTLEDAITRVAARIGWAEAGEAVGKVDKVVRNWSDPDMAREPTFSEMLALDAAYLRAGGGEPPILTAYARLLNCQDLVPADAAQLAEITGKAARETGEALAALIAASQPGASQTERVIATREVSESIEVLTHGLRVLGPANAA